MATKIELNIGSEYRDVFSTISNQIWRLFSGPFIALLLPVYLTPEEQGFWYLFGSISVLTLLANLGFSNIVLQFSAQEFSFLELNENGSIDGSEYHVKKIGSFLRFVLRLTAIVNIVFGPVILALGVWFFYEGDVLFTYIFPWIIYFIGSLIMFSINILLSFVEGFNLISKVQQIRLISSIFNSVTIIFFLTQGNSILALSLGMIISAVVTTVIFVRKFYRPLASIFVNSYGFMYNWNAEFFPLLKRYSISFISGYFMFQSYVPLVHFFDGPINSGRIGLTLVAVLAIFNASNVWIYTIIPRINQLIARNLFEEIFTLANKRLSRSILLYLLGSLVLLVLLEFRILELVVDDFNSRIAGLFSVISLLGCYFMQLYINTWATILRSFKKEPYMWPSVIFAIWVFLSSINFLKLLGTDYIFLGLLSGYLWWFPLAKTLYSKKRKEYVQERRNIA